MTEAPRLVMHRRLVDSLYVEAMLLADETRAYFDEDGRVERESLDPCARVGFSCEALKVTTRLMHVIAWLLTQRAVAAGELTPAEALHGSRRLGEALPFDREAIAALPPRAGALVTASAGLHRRVAMREAALVAGDLPVASPARSMIARLALAV